MKTQLYLNNRRAKQRGLTLIELVVVLAILVALAGLIIQNFPGVISRAHTSTCATTVADVNKLMNYSFETKIKYPDGFDSLLNEDGTTLFSKLPGHAVGTPIGGATQVTTATLASGGGAALAAIGVTKAYKLNENGADATWNSEDLTNAPIVLTNANVKVATVTVNYATNLWANEIQAIANDTATQYVLFGLGSGCTAVGPSSLIQEAPTHFGDNANMNPYDNYQRYGVVFAVDTDSSTNTTARYVGAVALHDDSLGTSEGDIHDYYQVSQ